MKPHGMTGQRNAAKEGCATSYIHARCRPEDKASWIAAAKSEGMKLTEWIVSTLNHATKRDRAP